MSEEAPSQTSRFLARWKGNAADEQALSEALYGERPFAGRTPSEICEAIVEGRARPLPREARVPAWIQAVLSRGLRADPAGRPASMNELLAALDRDPRTARLRALGVALLVLALGAAAPLLGWASRGPSAVCTGADQKLAGVWDEGRRAAVRAALVASGKPWAGETLRVVEGALDGYARGWVSMRTQACEATRVTRDQSEALLDLRMRCLDGRLEEMRAVTEALSVPDEKLLGSAARAARSLSALRACADVDALLAPVPLPVDPKMRAEVEALRLELARVKALQGLGRYREAEAQAAALIERVRPLGYDPLLAQALFVWGKILDLNGDAARAADAFHEALWAAESGRDRQLSARILAELVWEVGSQMSRPDAGHEYARHAGALLRGLGGDAEIEALVADNEGALLVSEGRYVEAEKRHREAADKREIALGVDAPQYGVALVNVGVALSWQGKGKESLAFIERGVAVYGRALGEHHPLYGGGLSNLGAVLCQAGRYDEARVDSERALVLLTESLGPEHPLIATAENSLGVLAMAQHRPADALGHFERALLLGEKLRGTKHVLVANYLAGLANALRALRRYPEALDAAQRAVAIYRDQAGNETLVARSETLIGTILLDGGTPAAALPLFERSLGSQEKNEKSPVELADTRLSLARALQSLGRDPARSRRLAEEVLADCTSEAACAEVVAEARARLARAPRPSP